MSTTYLAGYDGSKAATSAVAFVSDLAQLAGARLIVANVAPYDPRPQRGNNADYARVVESDAMDVLAGAADASSRSGFDTRVVASSSPAHGLHDLAEETDASLIAIGSTERGRLTSVPWRLLNGAPCPVLVVPESQGDTHRIRVIAVAFDGGEEAMAAVHEAERIAIACGASLRLIAVDEPTPSSPAVPVGYVMDQSKREWLDSRIQAVLGDLAPEVSADATIEKGEAESVFVKACHAGVDLLVTGSRGYGPTLVVLLGSFSHKLVRDIPCPVLVVPRAWENRLEDRMADNEVAAGAR